MVVVGKSTYPPIFSPSMKSLLPVNLPFCQVLKDSNGLSNWATKNTVTVLGRRIVGDMMAYPSISLSEIFLINPYWVSDGPRKVERSNNI